MRSEGIGARSERLTKADVERFRADMERAFNAMTWKLIGVQLLTAGIIIAALKFL